MMEFMMNTKFQQRKTTLLKKARDLQILCDVKVGLIIYENPSRTAEAEIWPDHDLELINELIDSYRKAQNRPTKKRKLDDPSSCSSLAANKKPKTESTTTTEYAVWDHRFDVMSMEKIKDLECFLAEKIADLKAKCEILKATPPPVVVQEEDKNQSVSCCVVDQVPDATVPPTYYYDDDVYPRLLGGGHYGSITEHDDEEEYEGFVDEFGLPVSSTGNSMQTMVIPAWNDRYPPQYYSSMLCGCGGHCESGGGGGFGYKSVAAAAAMLAEGVGWFMDGHSPLLGAQIVSYSGPPSALSW